MDPQVASIRQAMADTRAAMTQKIDLLEARLQQTVHGVKTAAGDVIDQAILNPVTRSQPMVTAAKAVLELSSWLLVGGGLLWSYVRDRAQDRSAAWLTRPMERVSMKARIGGPPADRAADPALRSASPHTSEGAGDTDRVRIHTRPRQAPTREASPGGHASPLPPAKREHRRTTLSQQLKEAWTLGGLSAKELTRRVIHEIQHDDCVGRAAQLAYYLLFALFPFFLFLTTLLGYLPVSNLLDQLMAMLTQMLPRDALALVQDNVQQLVTGQRGGLLSFGILAALWTSSSAITAIMDSLNRAYNVEEGRPFWKVRGLAILLTIGLSLLIIVSLVLLTFGPQIGGWVADYIGLGAMFQVAWNILRWPVIVFFLICALALIYYLAPDVEQEWKWITPGAVCAILAWIGASLGFAFYVNNFGSYNKTYGSIGAVIVLLTWMYVTGLLILVGGEINSEIEHAAPSGKAPGEKEQPQT
jgi:membrane protein